MFVKTEHKTDYKAGVVDIEQALLAKLFQDSWEKMSESERDQLRKELKIDPSLTSSAALAAIITAIRVGGFMSYQIAMIVANAVAKAILGSGLTIAANAGLARVIDFCRSNRNGSYGALDNTCYKWASI